jgi:hypothetical protein
MVISICKNGHPLEGDNIYITPSTGIRRCRKCNSKTAQRWQLANPERTLRNRRNAKYLSKYGITSAQYDELLENQGGRCAICTRPPIKRRLCVDHNHSNGKVRGLLCDQCNLFVALLESEGEETHVRITNLVSYLA